jgi:hypothetical protein
MSRTQSSLYSDTPHQGGLVYLNAIDLAPNFSANLVLTRNALGDYSLNRTAAGAETYQVVAALKDLKRIAEVATAPMPFQEQFIGTPPISAPGVPPFAGANQLIPPANLGTKGIKVKDVFVVYQVFAEAVAPAVTNLPIDATALVLTTQATPHVAVRAVTAPAFEVTDLSDLTLEFAATMANTGTLRVYGLGFHVDFNLN